MTGMTRPMRLSNFCLQTIAQHDLQHRVSGLVEPLLERELVDMGDKCEQIVDSMSWENMRFEACLIFEKMRKTFCSEPRRTI